MNKIFEFTSFEILYKRCILASIAHAIMVGKYDMLASEQSWDGANYNFQDMEGIRGVFSFEKECYVCAIQNSQNFLKGTDKIVAQLLDGADKSICELAQNEALEYLMIDDEGKVVPAATAIFWGDRDSNYCDISEQDFMEKSDRILLPYLFDEEDAVAYWKDYYEMNSEQIQMLEELYALKMSSDSKIIMDNDIRDRLIQWFEEIDDCIESFAEMDMYFN